MCHKELMRYFETRLIPTGMVNIYPKCHRRQRRKRRAISDLFLCSLRFLLSNSWELSEIGSHSSVRLGQLYPGAAMSSESNSTSSVYARATLGRLLDEHRPKLLAMLQRRIDPALNARVDPDDILNDAFMVARRRWSDFQAGTMTPYAWLYRLALDQLIEAWRNASRGRRDVRKEMPWPDGTSIQLGLGLVSPGTSPSAALARDELREQVRQVMGLLKEKDREILWMRHVEDLTHPEIAAVLGITEEAAQQRYHRAVGRLSDLWHKLYPEECNGTV